MRPTVITLFALALLTSCGSRTISTGARGGDGVVAQPDASAGDLLPISLDTKSLGCSTNAHCPAIGYYCHLDGCLSSGTRTGTCKLRPLGCPDDLRPTCGCDGKIYSNSCAAHVEGVNVTSSGACRAACNAINNTYIAEVAKAKRCCAPCFSRQCLYRGQSELGCPCTTFLNRAPSTKMKQAEAQWKAKNCGIGWGCDLAVCPEPRTAHCRPGSAGAPDTCADLLTP